MCEGAGQLEMNYRRTYPKERLTPEQTGEHIVINHLLIVQNGRPCARRQQLDLVSLDLLTIATALLVLDQSKSTCAEDSRCWILEVFFTLCQGEEESRRAVRLDATVGLLDHHWHQPAAFLRVLVRQGEYISPDRINVGVAGCNCTFHDL